jgi:hypothetical protein
MRKHSAMPKTFLFTVCSVTLSRSRAICSWSANSHRAGSTAVIQAGTGILAPRSCVRAPLTGLLLQVDSDDDAGMMWGDGRIYYWIRRENLIAGHGMLPG